MEYISFELDGRIVVFLILAWLVHMAINKLVPTLRKGDPNPARKDDPASLPSSSSESHPPKHDVFLSFRGTDTRKGITKYLYDELQKKGIRTYIDAINLSVGSAISPSLLMAIEESTFAIVILSQNYASSPWCLEELIKIVQCMYDEERILPLFYNVDPSDVRHQKGSYEVAFKEHEKKSRHKTEKLNQWRDALRRVANLSGWDSRNFKSDTELVKQIVEFVYTKVRFTEHEWAMSTEDFEVFGSTKEAMNEVMKDLKDAEVTVVGVYGMGGVGKTTLVKHVGEQIRKIGIFYHVIIVAITQSPNLRKIQGTLADLLRVNLEGETEIRRADELYKEIMSKSNVLIILDDVWNRVELSSIGIPSYDKLKTRKSKVLLTTRRTDVCQLMKCQSNISLNILSEEDSLRLFMKNATQLLEKSTEFHDISRKVVRECGGLPIALKAVARALGDKDIEEWEKAFQRLAKSQLAIPEDERDAFKCIKLSYDYLKDEDCKSCFLFCCLFPEDHNIPVTDLLTYGFGKGLFRDADTFLEAKGAVESIVKHLKCSSLLMNGENNRFIKMHDVIRDTAIQIAQDSFLVRSGLSLKDWPRRLHEGYYVVSLMWNYIDHLPTQMLFPKLQMLLLQHNGFRQIPETFFQSLNELKVLDLSHTKISELPQSSSFLINLQALYLNDCKFLVDISVVSKLEKLEILSMQLYMSEELPREIGDLTSLKILDVSGSKIFRIPPNVLSKLHRLEELCLNWEFWKWGSCVEEGQEPNASFQEVLSLSNLRVLQVCISDAECIPKTIETEPNWVEFAITIGRGTPALFTYLSPRRMVEIHRASTLPDWLFRVVIYKAEKLSWKNNLRLADILVEYEHGKFHGLKYLSINGRNSSGVSIPIRYGHLGSENGNQSCNWDSRKELRKDPLLENLEELHLGILCPGEELYFDALPPGSLFNLKVLNLSNCNNWGNVLFPATLLKRFPNLEKLTGSLMNRANYVFGCEDYLLVQSKLRNMVLRELCAVRSICEGPAPLVMFQTLQHLTISRCGFRGSLFTSEVAHCLLQLEDFMLKYCPSVHRLVESCNKKIIFPKLKILTLEDLPELCYESATIDIECPSLGELDVEDCPKFLVSLSDFQIGASLQAEEH